MTLTGHEGAVWGIDAVTDLGLILTGYKFLRVDCILYDMKYMLSIIKNFCLKGSADKTIKMWRAGKCEKTFVGHTDCVREVVALDNESFLSCSNDG